MTATRRPVGIVGGSGLYSLLDDAEPAPVATPFGDPSDPPQVGELAGRPVVFLPRHGADHRYPPHLVNYRANLWALRALGVRQVLTPCAVGALRPDLAPGTLVVPDQVIDMTRSRPSSVYSEVGAVVHVGFADPYCPVGRRTVAGVPGPPLPVVDGGTLVVIEGPRFSTRAESRRHRALGGDVVGMTGMPEAAVARELALCCTTMCVVTDHDAGVSPDQAVTHRGVLEQFARSIAAVRDLLTRVVAALPDDDACPCRHSVDGLTLPFDLP